MKKIVVFGLLLLIGMNGWGQKIFHSRSEMNEYAFQNTSLRAITDGYFLNFNPTFTPQTIDSVYTELGMNKEVDINNLIAFLKVVQDADITRRFKVDSLLFPVMDEIYSNYGTNKLNIPIIIGDMNFSYLKEETYKNFKTWNSKKPFPSIQKNEIQTKNLVIAGLFVNQIVNNNIRIYWSDKTYLHNTKRTIKSLKVHINGESYSIRKGVAFPLYKYFDANNPLISLKIEIIFSDGKKVTKISQFTLRESNDFPSVTQFTPLDKSYGKSGYQGHWLWQGLGGFSSFGTILGNIDSDNHGINVTDNTLPDLNFSVLWGCDNGNYDKILDKPFIIVAGWGPYTDRSFINNHQGWPSSIQETYWSFNQYGYIDSLAGVGYDVIISRFYPPNASELNNSKQLEKLINLVNAEKFYNGSYQENVITGYSAGSMCVRLTLERMEYQHLKDASTPHHHCKLYISFEGEQNGANVPLGIQHSVEYLWYYHTSFGGFFNFTIYALHYILNAPLSKELLAYFYTKTGSPANPGQGHAPERSYFMSQLWWNYNHSKNTDNQGYPAFTRNIALSNGTSQRTASSELSTYSPYSPVKGKLIFKNDQGFPHKEKTQVYLLGRNDGLVFKNQRKPWFQSWEVRMDKVTDNPWILDNAPGGTTLLTSPDDCADPNIMYQVLNRMEKKTGGSQIIAYSGMYSFTPLILTFDIRNFPPPSFPSFSGGILMRYDMKAQGLMYQNINNVGHIDSASSYYGYPHLAHPNNHYSKYTPFDAVFAWDSINTVHIQSGEPYWDNNENHGCKKNKNNHKRWEQHDSPIRAKMTHFLLGEADVYNSYIQNRRYGWNANPNYLYRADIVSKHNIYAGDSVTQRTDFKPVEIDENAQVRFIACNNITLKPGFHAKAGSQFLAKIDPTLCNYCGVANISTNSRHSSDGRDKTKDSPKQLNKPQTTINKVKIYPNPAQEKAHIVVTDRSCQEFSCRVYDLEGRIIKRNKVKGRRTTLYLSKGIYIVKVKIETRWYTKKLIMY